MTPHVNPTGAHLYYAKIHADKERDLYVVDFDVEPLRRRAAPRDR